MIDLQEILARMNPNQKINYDRVMQQMTKVWARESIRPRILMHVCCAPLLNLHAGIFNPVR